MCGIVGYIGKSEAIPILVDALKKLEYRGYDSAGIAFLNNKLKVYKTKGRIEDLEKILPDMESHIGIGHTRWSTHGRPNDINAHPHTSGNIAVVHNGIIENYQKLKEKLEKKYKFVSETDTEVIAHLINYYYNGNLVQSVKNALSELEGSYAIAVICKDSPDLMVVARKDSPLIVGVGENENFVASDIPAVLKYTKKIIYLDDYDIAIIKKDGIEFFNNGYPITKEINTVEWDEKAAEKAGYEHFMLKEIHEQPTSVFETLRGRISEMDGTVNLDIKLAPDQVIELNKIEIIACGTSYNAGLVGKYLFEILAGIPTTIEVASEFRYSNPILDGKALVIAITQSGETADTLAAIREAKSYGCKTLAITNVVGSTITR
ncbi:MAG: glutamine--fructose-6-phosphate transaminase (isomerizing), partial [Methanosarcinales archaeon]